MTTKIHQNKVIRAVLKFLSRTININYKIIKYPDEIERNLPACDALAIIGSKKVAIEHTSIDSIPNQRKDDSRFMRVLGDLRYQLKNKLPTPGHYQLIVTMGSIPAGKGIKWDDIHKRIYEWCLKVAPNLETGSPFVIPRHFIREKPNGVPFEVSLYRWPGKNGEFKIGRFSPEDLEAQRKEVIYKTIESRGAKVSSYKNDGYRTLLILESNDIALSNVSVVGQALLGAINEINNSKLLPDEIYLIETERIPYYAHCLKFGDTLFPNAIIKKEPYI